MEHVGLGMFVFVFWTVITFVAFAVALTSGLLAGTARSDRRRAATHSGGVVANASRVEITGWVVSSLFLAVLLVAATMIASILFGFRTPIG